MTVKIQELRPCPFCGGKRLEFVDGVGGFHNISPSIRCVACDCQLFADYNGKRPLQEKWNTRPVSDTADA
jgi:hypothetical protein